MINKLIARSTFLASLLLLSIAMPSIAADKPEMMQAHKDKSPQSAMSQSMQQMEKVNVNLATSKELAAIKGLGTKKAQAIIDYRKANGDFTDMNQLMNIKGIGQGTLKKIAPFLEL